MPTTNAVEIMHLAFANNAERQESLKRERQNAHIAREIYSMRKKSGLTQKELADLIGTQQSVISRLEDADYDGHSMSMLARVATALNHELQVDFIPVDAHHNQKN